MRPNDPAPFCRPDEIARFVSASDRSKSRARRNFRSGAALALAALAAWAAGALLPAAAFSAPHILGLCASMAAFVSVLDWWVAVDLRWDVVDAAEASGSGLPADLFSERERDAVERAARTKAPMKVSLLSCEIVAIDELE